MTYGTAKYLSPCPLHTAVARCLGTAEINSTRTQPTRKEHSESQQQTVQSHIGISQSSPVDWTQDSRVPI
jgi:hypothetical protein